MGAKTFKSLDEQVEILKGKGLVIEDYDKTKDILLRENYFFGIIATNIDELNLNLKEISEVRYISRSNLENFDVVPIHKKIIEELFSQKG